MINFQNEYFIRLLRREGRKGKDEVDTMAKATELFAQFDENMMHSKFGKGQWSPASPASSTGIADPKAFDKDLVDKFLVWVGDENPEHRQSLERRQAVG